MKAIVSLLPEELSDTVHGIWRELESDFGFKSVLVTPFPHFTYCIVSDEKAEPCTSLERTAAQIRPFRVRTEYLGVFSGERPVIFIGIARNPELAALHKSIRQDFCSLPEEDSDLYGPQHWIPHITLALGNELTRENIGPIMERLAFRDFHTEFVIDNITVLEGSLEEGVRIERRFSFSAIH